MTRFEFQVSERERKMRLEDFLLGKFRFLSKMYLREVVRDGACQVNGRIENRGRRLLPNDFVEIEVDFERQKSLQPEPLSLAVLYEDESILVVDKPPGMLVHPTLKVKTGTLLNALAFHLNENRANEFEAKENRPPAAERSHIRAGLIHRLDKKTSGLILISKNARAHRILASHFERKLIEKKYYALIEGAIDDDAGTIDAPIGRYEEKKIWNVKADGKPSTTKFRVVERFADRTLLELEPVTGRTNQIRIHLAHAGHPIVGDATYGGRPFSRMCLHAYKLAFLHPCDARQMKFETALPAEFSF